jgi:hemoglobin
MLLQTNCFSEYDVEKGYMKKDIQSRQDIELLITSFYAKVRSNNRLAPHFANVDWQHHTPVIIDFWAMILLGDQAYKGNPFAKHVDLKVKANDFQEWLKLFHQTVDEHFSGAVAEEAKNRANNIAGIFRHKLGVKD